MTAPPIVGSVQFGALGDPNRLSLLSQLCVAGPSSTTKVGEGLSITRQAATKHLELLESAGLVSSCRRGRERIWTARIDMLIHARDYLGHMKRRCDIPSDRARPPRGIPAFMPAEKLRPRGTRTADGSDTR